MSLTGGILNLNIFVKATKECLAFDLAIQAATVLGCFLIQGMQRMDLHSRKDHSCQATLKEQTWKDTECIFRFILN